MHILRILFIRLGIAAILLGTALWGIAKWVDIDRHRETVVQRLNRSFGVAFNSGRARLSLFPFVGVVAEDLRLGDLAGADRGEFRVELRSLFQGERHLHFTTDRILFHLAQRPDGSWNFDPFLRIARSPRGKTGPKDQGKERPRPSSLEAEIARRSQELVKGQFTKVPPSTPTPWIQVPALPTPAPERSSVFENLVVSAISAERAEIRVTEIGGTQLLIQARDLELRRSETGFRGSLIMDATSDDKFSSVLAACSGESLDQKSTFVFDLQGPELSVKRWSLSKGSTPWSGTILRDGSFQLESGKHRVSGNFHSSRCMLQP